MDEDWEERPCCNIDTLTALDWSLLTDLLLIGSIESRTVPGM